jgi:hypothetical protein
LSVGNLDFDHDTKPMKNIERKKNSKGKKELNFAPIELHKMSLIA